MKRLELALVATLVLGGALSALFVVTQGRAQEEEGSERSTRASRHASLTEGLDCATCHTTESWSMAEGSSAGRGFDHARTGFPLTGQHNLATCAECHRRGFEVRRECASCHDDDHHQGRLGRDCDRCHTARSWSDTRPFEIHRRTRLPLTGMHALADCTQCHQRVDEREHTAPPADCFSCHDADYRGAHAHTGTATTPPFPRDCGLCHVATGWTPALFDPTAPAAAPLLMAAPPQHEVIFPIRTGSHRAAACSTCHLTMDLPRLVECTGCHNHDPVTLQRQHGGRAIAGDAASCLGCHPGGVRR